MKDFIWLWHSVIRKKQKELNVGHHSAFTTRIWSQSRFAGWNTKFQIHNKCSRTANLWKVLMRWKNLIYQLIWLFFLSMFISFLTYFAEHEHGIGWHEEWEMDPKSGQTCSREIFKSLFRTFYKRTNDIDSKSGKSSLSMAGRKRINEKKAERKKINKFNPISEQDENLILIFQVTGTNVPFSVATQHSTSTLRSVGYWQFQSRLNEPNEHVRLNPQNICDDVELVYLNFNTINTLKMKLGQVDGLPCETISIPGFQSAEKILK